MILVRSGRKITESFSRKGVVGCQKSQLTTDFNQKSGTYIVYNSHVTFYIGYGYAHV